MIKKYKNEIIMFLILFVFSILMCNGFVRMHYTVDTYKVADVGYVEYATKWSLKDGRILMYIILLVMNICNVPLVVSNYIFEICAIIISIISVMTIYNMILKFKSVDSIKGKSIILIASYLVIFNFMYLEIFYFLESIIISTSILLFILSTKNILKGTLKGVIIGTILSIVSMFVYQGSIGFFIVFSISMLIIKNQKINKDLMKHIFFIGVITFISVLINLIIVKYIDDYLGIYNARLGLKNIIYNIRYMINNIHLILINTCGLLPKYVFLLSIVGLIFFYVIYNIFKKEDKQHIINILFIFIIAIFGSFVLFVGTTTSFNCGRMYVRSGCYTDAYNTIFVCRN